MLKSLLNLFDKSKVEKDSEKPDDDMMVIGGIMVEAAAIDGKIDEREVLKIKNSMINVFKINQKNTDFVLKKCLERVDEPNSLYSFSSKINKNFQHDKKIDLLEILWEIILVDGEIHDFESNLIRRIAGLLYISDIECGNAKKRILEKINERN